MSSKPMSSKPMSSKRTDLTKPQSDTWIANGMPGGAAPSYIQAGKNRGNENVVETDVTIPRLDIVQALSPQVKEGDPKFNDKARPGMLCNSVTGQIYGREVYVVPIIFIKQWLVWKARKDKDGRPLEGGFYGAYSTFDEARARQLEEGGDDNSIEIIETPQHLCLLLPPPGTCAPDETSGPEEVMISMPRTKAKISRRWNSLVRLAGGDRFSRAYKVTTQFEQKPQGSFYNFDIVQSGFPSESLYRRAESLYETISAGRRQVVVDMSGLGSAQESDITEM